MLRTSFEAENRLPSTIGGYIRWKLAGSFLLWEAEEVNALRHDLPKLACRWWLWICWSPFYRHWWTNLAQAVRQMFARNTTKHFWPKACSRDIPVIFSAARLKKVILLSRSTVKTPSATEFRIFRTIYSLIYVPPLTPASLPDCFVLQSAFCPSGITQSIENEQHNDHSEVITFWK